MSCLSHHKRFRSLFHNIINELRRENCIPISALHTMPFKCCTCREEVHEIPKPVILANAGDLPELNNLIEKVNREKDTDVKLLLSLNRFQDLIVEAQSTVSLETSVNTTNDDDNSSESKPKRIVFSSSDENDSSSESEDMVLEPPRTNRKSRQPAKSRKSKPAKQIKSGVFVYLPYEFKNAKAKGNADVLTEIAKSMQKKRFINKNGHFPILEREYNACISMITKKTSQGVTDAFETAKRGLENLKIHNRDASLQMAENQDGEWVLIRAKKASDSTNGDNIDQLLDEITSRWASSLKIEKRKTNDERSSKRTRK
ncbi:unnamed protein product [Adineta ricciae]|uniref:Uncharacterized protein n=1 Tax=Adineta ricciae TaxID=249248 RepID=A0A813V3P7_ADIRI|nr:unnamed protein product [Adineta ricciae]